MSAAAPDPLYDVVIIGAGPTGAALAAALGGIGASVLLVEERPIPDLTAAPFDGRVTAIALGSKLLLDSIGAWEGMAPEAEPILEIAVAESDSPAGVTFHHDEVGDDPVGWIAENRDIRKALFARLEQLPGVTLKAPLRLETVEQYPGHVRLGFADGSHARGRLLAVCEGRFSGTREKLGIGAKRWAYDQTAIVCTLDHEKPHEGRATEMFFADGPLALLPMTGNRSSVVWALETGLAKTVAALDAPDLAAEIQARFGDSLGDLSLTGPRWTYPLVLVWSDRYTTDRTVLVGDTARGIHPIAGQGWNLALRDVAAVAEIVADRLRLGLDPGDGMALERYEAWRRFDSLALVAITDGINRLFANDTLPLRMLRDMGLVVVDHTPFARRFFMRHAMGQVGDLPRLMRGQPL